MRRSIGMMFTVVLATGVATTSGLPPAGATSGTATYEYSADPQYFTVPDGVTQITIDAYGASGGNAVAMYAGDIHDATTRGLGGWTRSELAVTPGQVLQINVGHAGSDGQINEVVGGWNIAAGAGGDNGGGNGGTGQSSFVPPFQPSHEYICAVAGGGGGGASDVRTGAYSLNDRVAVGAGGGGTGGYIESYFFNDINQFAFTAGGGGGGAVGADGVPSTDLFLPSLFTGTGGTPLSGGAFGGTAGVGGDGVGQPFTKGDCSAGAEGGGGGGLFGGGAGWGGGGGSAYPTTLTVTGVMNGNGRVVISYGGGAPTSPDPGSSSTSTTPATTATSPDAAAATAPLAVSANPSYTG